MIIYRFGVGDLYPGKERETFRPNFLGKLIELYDQTSEYSNPGPMEAVYQFL